MYTRTQITQYTNTHFKGGNVDMEENAKDQLGRQSI